MSAAINTGGPAFPDPGRAQSEKQREKLPNTGMTLRDYFAAKAMQGGLCEGSEIYKPAEFAKWCYDMADAMLAARQSDAVHAAAYEKAIAKATGKEGGAAHG